MLPLPMRLGSIEEFVARPVDGWRAADSVLFVIDPQLAPFIAAPRRATLRWCGSTSCAGDQAGCSPASAYARPADDPEALAILQFTSGSTADPKGVMLPHRTVCANLDAITGAAELTIDDVVVSWLPLYHDMGLVGFCMLPLSTGTDLVLGAPQDFLAAPSRWLEWLSTYGGTATAGPNFSWVLAGRAARLQVST